MRHRSHLICLAQACVQAQVPFAGSVAGCRRGQIIIHGQPPLQPCRGRPIRRPDLARQADLVAAPLAGPALPYLGIDGQTLEHRLAPARPPSAFHANGPRRARRKAPCRDRTRQHAEPTVQNRVFSVRYSRHQVSSRTRRTRRSGHVRSSATDAPCRSWTAVTARVSAACRCAEPRVRGCSQNEPGYRGRDCMRLKSSGRREPGRCGFARGCRRARLAAADLC